MLVVMKKFLDYCTAKPWVSRGERQLESILIFMQLRNRKSTVTVTKTKTKKRHKYQTRCPWR